MLRIALISPKGPLYRYRGGIFKKSLRYQPLTLPTLVSLIPPEIEHEVQLFDEGIQEVPEDLDVDLVGMTVMTGTARRSYELAAIFRQRGIPVVLGGPHPTLVPEDAAPHCDSVVTGYAEDSWPQLLRDFVAAGMKPRYDQAPDLEIGGRPFIDRSLLPASGYMTQNVFEATRGCIHACEFCVVPSAWGKKPFQKPIDEVIEDIRRTRAKRAIFIDLNIIADKEHAARLFEALVPLNIIWFGLATVLLAKDKELLELCARSGCRGLLVGLESISTTNLRNTRKGFQDPGDFKELIQIFHRHQIGIQGCFVFGLDEDTPQTIRETAQFAVDAAIDLPRFAIATPFPGTPLYHRMKAEDRLLNENWDLYDSQHVVFQPAHMTPEELTEATRAAWGLTYSVPNMVRRLWHSPLPKTIAFGANTGYRFYGKNLQKYYVCDWPVGRDPAIAPPPPTPEAGPSPEARLP